MSTLQKYRIVGKTTNYWVALQRFFCLSLIATLAACGSTRLDNAPVLERSDLRGASAQATVQNTPPGYYRVKMGDTLYRVALEHGQNYRDIATWNNVQDPSQIEVGQLLRVAAPGANIAPSSANVANSVADSPLRPQALNAGPAPGAVAPNAMPESAGPVLPRPVSSTVANNAPPKPTESVVAGAMTFAWPVQGVVLDNFEEGKNKGINIGGVAGTAVKAAAEGRVVYAGNGLRGYGNLIIIKHNDQFLTAYAHNRALLVKENDTVKKGQEIAEMGNGDAERVMLHFEIRRQGKPVDPLTYLSPLQPD